MHYTLSSTGDIMSNENENDNKNKSSLERCDRCGNLINPEIGYCRSCYCMTYDTNKILPKAATDVVYFYPKNSVHSGCEIRRIEDLPTYEAEEENRVYTCHHCGEHYQFGDEATVYSNSNDFDKKIVVLKDFLMQHKDVCLCGNCRSSFLKSEYCKSRIEDERNNDDADYRSIFLDTHKSIYNYHEHDSDNRVYFDDDIVNGCKTIVASDYDDISNDLFCPSMFKGFGFELEVDDNSFIPSTNQKSIYNNRVCNEIEKCLLKNEMLFEYDGSLNNGFECIFQPHSIKAYEMQKDSINKVLRILQTAGFKSHDASTCGLHVHVSKKWFGDTPIKQHNNIAKVYMLYDKYWHDFVKASRRRYLSYCEKNDKSIAARHFYKLKGSGFDFYHYTDEDIADIATLRKVHAAFRKQVKRDELTRHSNGSYNMHNSHHVAINCANKDTLEFRLCKGTLNTLSFHAWIDLCLCITKAAASVKVADVFKLHYWFKDLQPSTVIYLLKRNAFTDALKTIHPDIFALYMSTQVQVETDNNDNNNIN